MTKRDKLKKILKIEIKKANKRVIETKTAANEIAKSMGHSWSQSGDVEHARGQAEIVKENLKRLENLLNEINKSTDSLYVLVETEGEKKEYYILKYTAYIKGINILSKDSNLGKKILKRQKGDKIVFKGKTIKILEIE